MRRYEEIPRDLVNRVGSEQHQPRFLCYRRGYGAPILDVAVVYERAEMCPIGFQMHHRALFSDTQHTVRLGIKRQAARFIPATRAPVVSAPRTSALGVGDVLSRLAGGTLSSSGGSKHGKEGRAGARSLGSHEVFVAEEGIVDIALVAVTHKARTAEDLRHVAWVCSYRKERVLVDISDGVVRTEPLYLVYQRGSARVPITAIRVVESVPAATGGGSKLTDGDDDGWTPIDVSLPDFLLGADDRSSGVPSVGVQIQVCVCVCVCVCVIHTGLSCVVLLNEACVLTYLVHKFIDARVDAGGLSGAPRHWRTANHFNRLYLR
jgi:hypothetical protein